MKKRIVKLEINKEDILNLSQAESQKIVGGGDTLTYDNGDTCQQLTLPDDCNRTEEGCQGYTEGMDSCDGACGVSDDRNCYTGDVFQCNGTRT